LRKQRYIIYVSRDEEGRLEKVPIPLRYGYIFVAAAVIGAFTITGIAGSYSRMLLKTARFNQVRSEHEALRRDYKNLEQVAEQKDVQAASLGSLASEITRFYGLRHASTAGAVGVGKAKQNAPAAAEIAATPAQDGTFTQASYYRSLSDLTTLRDLAMDGAATQGLHYSLGVGASTADWEAMASSPTLWPIEGPVTSSFGEREDPFNGEGAFHQGIDISAHVGTPVHAPATGRVVIAGFGLSGYGREVVLDHGHGVRTVFGHLSGTNVVPGQQVTRGDVIGYVGDSGRSTGAHLHYEVRLNDQPVNPHKYLRETMADLTAGESKSAM
jgi:murein DD-endopeptidase MepM/ murein hydrolase activator NlpD